MPQNLSWDPLPDLRLPDWCSQGFPRTLLFPYFIHSSLRADDTKVGIINLHLPWMPDLLRPAIYQSLHSSLIPQTQHILNWPYHLLFLFLPLFLISANVPIPAT